MAKKKKEDLGEVEKDTAAPAAPVVEEAVDEDGELADRILKDTGFECVNADKLERVVYGTMGRSGELEGGIGDKASSDDILANYDRIAGLVRKDGTKIKTGSFWNFARGINAPHKKPIVKYIFNVGGDEVEVDNPAELGRAMQTVEAARRQKEEKFKEKKAKSKFNE